MPTRVCLIAGSFTTTLPISNGLASWSRQNGPWRIDFLSPAESPDSNIGWIARAGYQGIVAVSPSYPIAMQLSTIGCPVVCVLHMPGPWPMSSTRIDDQAAGRVAATHLLERNYRHFAYYGVEAHWSQERYQGFSQALAAKGTACLSNAGPWPDWNEAQQARYVHPWLQQLPRPAAVLACDDLMARVLADACADLRLRVPNDLAILGIDNQESYCESDVVTLSSVDLNLEAHGREAGHLLSTMMGARRRRPVEVLVPPRGVIQRRSTDATALDDAEVAAAIRFIQQNACERIAVDDVAEHVAMSRRHLERRFTATLGRTPGEEIRRLRMDRARDLLLSTNMALTEIALRCGYEHLSSFSAAFAAAMGQPPSRYRRESSLA